MKALYLTLVILLSYSCEDQDQVLSEKTQLQAQEQLIAENENTLEWAEKLSEDIKDRELILEELEGEFEGTISEVSTNANIAVRFEISKSNPAFIPDRDLTLEELQIILEKMTLKAHVLVSSRDLSLSTGCVFENISVDFKTSEFVLTDSGCPYTYNLALNDKQYKVIRSYSNSIEKYKFEIGPQNIEKKQAVIPFFDSESEAIKVKSKLNLLESRYQFFNSVSGTYYAKQSAGQFNRELSINLDVNIPSYAKDINYSAEQIDVFLENLSFKARTSLWSKELSYSNNCLFKELSYDFQSTSLVLAGDKCDYSFNISVKSKNELFVQIVSQTDSKAYSFNLIKSNNDEQVSSFEDFIYSSELEGIKAYERMRELKEDLELMKKFSASYVGVKSVNNYQRNVLVSLDLKIPQFSDKKVFSAQQVEEIIKGLKFSGTTVIWSKELNFSNNCQFEEALFDKVNSKVILLGESCDYSFELLLKEEGFIEARVLSQLNSDSFKMLLEESESGDELNQDLNNFLFNSELEAYKVTSFSKLIKERYDFFNSITRKFTGNDSKHQDVKASLDFANTSGQLDFHSSAINMDLLLSYYELLKIDVSFSMSIDSGFINSVNCSLNEIKFNFDLGHIRSLKNDCDSVLDIFFIDESFNSEETTLEEHSKIVVNRIIKKPSLEYKMVVKLKQLNTGKEFYFELEI